MPFCRDAQQALLAEPNGFVEWSDLGLFGK